MFTLGIDKDQGKNCFRHKGIFTNIFPDDNGNAEIISFRVCRHQVDFVIEMYIYCWLQWLVKKAIETREELGDYIRQYSISQFDKSHHTPEVSTSHICLIIIVNR